MVANALGRDTSLVKGRVTTKDISKASRDPISTDNEFAEDSKGRDILATDDLSEDLVSWWIIDSKQAFTGHATFSRIQCMRCINR